MFTVFKQPYLSLLQFKKRVYYKLCYGIHSSPVALILLAMAYSTKWGAGGGRDVKTVFYELTMVSHTHKTLSHNAHT